MNNNTLCLHPYSPDLSDEWNQLVAASRNGSFLFDRRFMDYHQHRFTDCSLLFSKGNRFIACLPANYEADAHTVCSHRGLTFGGLVVRDDAYAGDVLAIYDLLTSHYRRQLQARTLIVKPIPHIYHRLAAEEELYALFRHGARLIARGLSSTIPLNHPLPLRESRMSGVRKALSRGVTIAATTDPDDVLQFWNLLDNCLARGHNVRPVHSPVEMLLLMERFPSQVTLHVARHEDGHLLAGTWVFHSRQVVHTQYMAASDEGKRHGALDLLVATLINDEVRATDTSPRYFDFGISTEQGGQYLNQGLAFQKEGFGGRAVCYDHWALSLQ